MPIGVRCDIIHYVSGNRRIGKCSGAWVMVDEISEAQLVFKIEAPEPQIPKRSN